MGRNPINKNSKANGFTLVEVVVGVAILLIVFSGIFSVYRLGMKVVFESKARIIGVSLANQKIEEARNLSYGNVGTFHCPEEHLECEYGDEWAIEDTVAGPIKREQTSILNNVNYTIFTKIDYISNCIDGIGDGTIETCPDYENIEGYCAETPCPEDECDRDYKKIKVTISWGHPHTGQISLESMISPKIKEQECGGSGGFLVVKIKDSLSQNFTSPQIDVENLFTYQTDNKSPESGECVFILDPGTGIYKINVSDGEGYTSVSTYGIGDEYNGRVIAVPFHQHASVIENDFWEESYYIDETSSFLIETFSRAETENFFDPLDNEDNISEKFQINFSGGQAELDINSGPYYNSGYIISETIYPVNLVLWEDIFFSDSQPLSTEIRYEILYYIGTEWKVIPNSALPENETGFTSSPINLFDLDPIAYPSIRIKANFLTLDTLVTPILEDWEFIWSTTDSIPIANVDFDIHSKKIVGKDSDNFDIYRYDGSYSTNGAGHTTLSNLEWDEYFFSNFSISGASLDLAKSRPNLSDENSIYLPAGTNENLKLFLETPYSLFLEVNDSSTGEDIIDANVHLYNISLGYDKIQLTNPDGKTIFFYLENDTYELEITANGYDPFLVESVSISGKEIKVVELVPSP